MKNPTLKGPIIGGPNDGLSLAYQSDGPMTPEIWGKVKFIEMGGHRYKIENLEPEKGSATFVWEKQV